MSRRTTTTTQPTISDLREGCWAEMIRTSLQADRLSVTLRVIRERHSVSRPRQALTETDDRALAPHLADLRRRVAALSHELDATELALGARLATVKRP